MSGVSAGGGLSYIYQPWDGSSLKLGYTSVASDYTVKQTDFMVDCSANTLTVTLPTAAGITGKIFCVKNSGVGVITVDGDGVETIDGQSNKLLSVQYESITVISNGSNWEII